MPLKPLVWAVCLTGIWAVASIASAKGASDGGVDLSGAYIYDAQAYANGQKNEQKFHYRGNRITLALDIPLQYKDAKGTIGPYGQQQVLVNNFEEENPNGGKGTETITMTGAGLQGVLVSDWVGNLHMSLAIGVSRVEIKQTGETPKTQLFPYAGEAKFGLGFGPSLAESGFFGRLEYQMVALWNGKTTRGGSDQGEDSEKLRNGWIEDWAPVVGYIVSF